MLYNIGIPGLIIILLIILIIVGPGKLPEIGRALGRSISEFKHESKHLLEDSQEKK